ncbi:MAG: 2-C-methyl-D-erythritol 4-phosphate cytidylyltransferase [Calditrichaeota bacterium]|nr:2-C-methyl-D-erythritol 4-phosphate cytidylyltransferase [Calditrichota bacterium]
MSYALLIPAAGRGERLGAPVSKALVLLNEKPLVWWALNAFVDDARLKNIVVATSPDDRNDFAESLATHPLSDVIHLTIGGETRQDSVGKALECVDENIDKILVHDAARPLLTRIVIDNVLSALENSVAAVPGIPVTDTIKIADKSMTVVETPPREKLFAVQTPQGVRAKEFRKAHLLARERIVQCTDDVALIETFSLGTVKIVPGDPRNLKITHPHELPRAEAILRGELLP